MLAKAPGALWTLSTHMVGSVSLTDQNSLLSELESAFKRDVLERDTFPPNTRSVETNASCRIWKA